MRKLFSISKTHLGDGDTKFSWSPRGHYLAAAGVSCKVVVFDRNGRLYAELPIQQTKLHSHRGGSCCLQLEWDSSGDKLAVLAPGMSTVLLWTASTNESQTLDTGLKNPELTWLGWSKKKPQLVVSTSKGHILLYNDYEKKKIPVMGKHTKRIGCGAWNQENFVVIGGDDKQLTLTDGTTGDTLSQTQVGGEPVEVCFASRKADDAKTRQDSTVSVCVARTTVCLFEVDAVSGVFGTDAPLELVFQEEYGDIQKHFWFGDGYIFLGFKTGHMAIVSSHKREVNEEVHSGRYLEEHLVDACYNEALGRIALGGGGSVRMLSVGAEFKELKHDALQFEPGEKVSRVGWTQDGQVFTVSTTNGEVHSYLAALPLVHDARDNVVLYLTSLLEVSLININDHRQKLTISTQMEPAFCGVGPSHFAVGMNNQVWYYAYDENLGNAVNVDHRDYLGSVEAIQLNHKCVALLAEGRVIVHRLEGMQGSGEDDEYYLPPRSQSNNVTCFALTDNFVVLGTSKGVLTYHLVDDYTTVNEYRHDESGIRRVFPQPYGAKLVFEDDFHNIFLFNPVNDECLKIPNFPGVLDKVLWDAEDSNVFIASDASTLSVYVYVPTSVSGDNVLAVNRQTYPSTHVPALVSNGIVWCQVKDGTLDKLALESHSTLQDRHAENVKGVGGEKRFFQALNLFKLKEAWRCALLLKNQKLLRKLGEVAMECLDVELAIAVYRQLGEASMVMSLESIIQYEDKNLLAGHTLVLMEKDINKAQELFLRSTMPVAALEMRQDLKHWDEALKLAEELDPAHVADICREHAQKLEMCGEYQQARTQYRQAIIKAKGMNQNVTEKCQAGIARTTLQLGDVREGKNLAIQIGNVGLCKECAGILESRSHLHDAAELYEFAGMYERAASIYIQVKSFINAAPLMAKIDPEKHPRLHVQFGRAKEKEGKFDEALEAYNRAGNMDDAVRILLDRLNRPNQAYAIVRQNPKIEPAATVAKYCESNAEYQNAVEFYMLAKNTAQAYQIATAHNAMDTYANFLQDDTPPDQYREVAEHYESRREFEKAGDLYSKAEMSKESIGMYMQVGGGETVQKCIDVVAASKDRALATAVLDWVLSEGGSTENDHHYIFQLHIALGQYEEACKNAVEFAKFEQDHNRHGEAHRQLFTTHQKLTSLGQTPSLDLRRSLMLSHSYRISRLWSALNDDMCAARLLIRVAQNISKFPGNTVGTLTSTVVACMRAGLRNTSLEYAAVLVRPEYRHQITPAYKRKIENLVRKPERGEEAEENLSECPYCNTPGKEMDLQCHHCQNLIPFCIATGKRTVLSDWGECPSCQFPCRFTDMLKVIQQQKTCPMCREEIDLNSFSRINKVL